MKYKFFWKTLHFYSLRKADFPHMSAHGSPFPLHWAGLVRCSVTKLPLPNFCHCCVFSLFLISFSFLSPPIIFSSLSPSLFLPFFLFLSLSFFYLPFCVFSWALPLNKLLSSECKWYARIVRITIKWSKSNRTWDNRVTDSKNQSKQKNNSDKAF